MSICHDEGYWQPDDPIAKHLPAFEKVVVFDGVDADGGLKTVAAASPPTLRQLLTHTAGLSYGFDPTDPLDKAYQAAKVWESDSLPQMAEKVAGLPLAYQPGTKWKYSMSMDIQGAMIERWTGQEACPSSTPEAPLRAARHEVRHRLPHAAREAGARLAKLYRFSPTQKKLTEGRRRSWGATTKHAAEAGERRRRAGLHRGRPTRASPRCC